MRPKSPRPPLEADSLRELALHYVGKYATSRARLLTYLQRKLRERGWDGEEAADPQALVERLTDLNYVDDGGYATMKSAALARRGYGPRRVEQALREAGIEDADRAAAATSNAPDHWDAANRFARRKRIGPYANAAPDKPQREKHVAAFLRAGHSYDVARRWVDAPPGSPPERPDI